MVSQAPAPAAIGGFEDIVLKQLDKVDSIATQVSNIATQVSNLESKAEATRKDIAELNQDIRRLEVQLSGQDGLIKAAVTVNVGAYLAPVIGLPALANGLGLIPK